MPNHRAAYVTILAEDNYLLTDPPMSKHWKIFWCAITLTVGLIGVLFVCAITELDWGREERAKAYMANHHCQVIGYAGRGPVPYYKCDNGRIMLKQDIYYIRD